jgi:hypothetical protein
MLIYVQIYPSSSSFFLIDICTSLPYHEHIYIYIYPLKPKKQLLETHLPTLGTNRFVIFP